MNFIEEMIKSLGCSFTKPPSYKAAFFGDEAAYFENICAIVSYSPEKITLALKKGGITLYGENLYVKKYCVGDVAICGKILKMERF